MAATVMSTRFALQALGLEIYGVYVVTASLPLMFTFLNGAMSATTQRMLAAGIGMESSDRRRTFSASLGPHLSIALLIVLAGETFGMWMFEHVLNMPETQRQSARAALRITVFAMAIGAFLAPYEALMRTRERFVPFAVLDVLRSVVILVGSWQLLSYSGDRLVAFSFLRSGTAAGVVLLGALYAAWQFPEARLLLSQIFNRSDVRERTGLISWTVFGSLAAIMRNQGFVVLANAMFGPTASAVLGVGNQLIGVLRQLSEAITQAFTPRIYQLEFASERSRMVNMALVACKCSALVGLIIALPLMIELPIVLKLWLGSPLPGASVAITLLVVALLLDQLSSTIGVVQLAIGRIAFYQLSCGIATIAAVPLGYLISSLGGELPDVLMALLATSGLVAVLRLVFTEPHSSGVLQSWLQAVVLPLTCGFGAGLTAGFAVVSFLEPSLVRLLVTSTTAAMTSLAVVYFCMPSEERAYVENAILQRLGFRTLR